MKATPTRMVAFFAGGVQAPLTAVVVVLEMTDEHSLILPFMGAAYVARMMARIVMPKPLYIYLAFGGSHLTSSL